MWGRGNEEESLDKESEILVPLILHWRLEINEANASISQGEQPSVNVPNRATHLLAPARN